MIITVYGNPTPLQRHRSFIRSGKIVTFDSQIKEKDLFVRKIRNQVCAEGVITSLLSKESYDVTLLFGMQYPKSKMKKNMCELNEIPHNVKPDIDNLIKFVLDCGNGLLWIDDKKINKITAKKIYVEYPKTIISIE